MARIKTLLTSILIGLSTPAHADCVTMQPLMAMHDAYRALVSDNSFHSKAVAANQLLKNVPVHTARTFKDAFTDMTLDVELARLEKVLIDGFFLGRDVLAGLWDQGDIPQFHTDNADWLNSTIARTGCVPENRIIRAGQNEQQTITAVQNRQPSRQITALQTSTLLAVLAALVATVAGRMIYKSRHFRIKRVERLPRHVVAFKATASFDASTRPVIVLDVSVGGAKVECDHPPVAKENIILHLPCGAVAATIVWATAFYAGVMFEKQLDDEQLHSILSDKGVTTRSRLSNVF